MRTSSVTAAVVLLLLSPVTAHAEQPAWLAQERFAVGVPAEVTLVGLGFGLHPEVLYAPLAPDGPLQLRAAMSTTVGPELALISPLALGVRGRLFAGRTVEPALGLGMQWQQFLPYGTDSKLRFDVYMELVASVRIDDDWRVDFGLSPEIGMLTVSGDGFERAFGLGMSARLGVRRALPW